MGWYTERVLPRIINRVMDNAMMRTRRERICAGLHGEVVELGFGTGLNVPYYPPAVAVVHAVEPSTEAMRLAGPRIAASPVTVRHAGLTGEHVDLPDAAFDAVLSTWTLCSIPDVQAALREVRRLLKPGGTFHFVEHGRAPDANVERWQRRIEPIQRRLAGGCHLTRDIDTLIRDAGFELQSLETSYARGEPRIFGWTFEGTARP